MTKHEFTERTNYCPTVEEYQYIEESYYEFDGLKDEFCKQWLKDKESGKWELELRLRKEIYQQKKDYEAKIEEMEENLHWYREQYREQFEEIKKYKGMVRRITNIINE